jgi:hypothetical protein
MIGSIFPGFHRGWDMRRIPSRYGTEEIAQPATRPGTATHSVTKPGWPDTGTEPLRRTKRTLRHAGSRKVRQNHHSGWSAQAATRGVGWRAQAATRAAVVRDK